MFPYEISFTDTDPKKSVKKLIEEHLTSLNEAYGRITSCHVYVRKPHKHSEKSFFHINIVLRMPGKEFVVSREPELNFDHTDPFIAVHDAFEALVRQIDDYQAQMKEVPRESHGPSHGLIKSFDPNTGYGFIETADGREVYFNELSLLGKNSTGLEKGIEVRFHEEQGDKGSQASSLAVVGHS